ncbi:MAG: alpha/beta fold hydrolase [Chloroflexota bacterium]
MATDKSNVSEQWVDLSHGRTRYLESGSGEPTIFLHGVGFVQAAHTWRPNLEAIGQKTRAIAIDCLGWGLGDRLDMEYSFAYIVDFVREFQDALGIERSNIVGHSMGGWLASIFAYESPGRVNKLILVGSGGTRTRTIPSMTEFQPPNPDQVRESLKNQLHLTEEWVDALLPECLRVLEVPNALEVYRKILKHMNNQQTRDKYGTVRRLPHVKAPTLVVWGDTDEVNALEMGQHTAELVPNSKLVVLKDTGHFAPTQRINEFNNAVLEFL